MVGDIERQRRSRRRGGVRLPGPQVEITCFGYAPVLLDRPPGNLNCHPGNHSLSLIFLTPPIRILNSITNSASLINCILKTQLSSIQSDARGKQGRNRPSPRAVRTCWIEHDFAIVTFFNLLNFSQLLSSIKSEAMANLSRNRPPQKVIRTT